MSILNPHKRNIFASVEEEVEIDENFPHTLYGSDGVTLIGLPTRESVPHKFQPKPTTYDEPIVFQSHTHLWKARLCSIFHLSTPFLFVLIIFVIFTYTNCLLQIFAQFTVEEQYRVKVSKSLEGIHRLRDLTDHLSPELQGQILKGAMELIPWSKSIDNNTWLACTDRNCTHVIDPLYDLPNPYPECVAQLHPNWAVAGILIMFGANYTCMDVFFSGHSVFFGLIMMTWFSYSGKGWIDRAVNVFVFLVTLGGWLMIVMTHFHYTLDVCYGAMISVVAYRVYFLMIRTDYGRRSLFFIWFEGIRRYKYYDQLDEWWMDHNDMVKSDTITKDIFTKAKKQYGNNHEWKDYLEITGEERIDNFVNALVHKDPKLKRVDVIVGMTKEDHIPPTDATHITESPGGIK